MNINIFYALCSTAEEILASNIVEPSQEELNSLNLHDEILDKCLLFSWYHMFYK